MFLIKFFYFCLITNTIKCIDEDRKIYRLVGGHINLKTSFDDTELLEAHSSGSKDVKKIKTNDTNDEDKKTLSQQVSEGKYGLIQKEIFKKPLKQPGIISYDANPEVPKDNADNLGGLNKEDIWLAENHLLVIRGGTYPKQEIEAGQLWSPIDNYTAPKRPVKLPKNPKVPPPFPVQLTENGPLQILGTNSTRTFDGPPPVYALPPIGGSEIGYIPGTGPYFPKNPDQTDVITGGVKKQNIKNTQGEEERGPPFPPSLLINGTIPPSFAHLPPGAIAVPPPPPINDFNEDDPSIYYPPPYSFSYPSFDNRSNVAAGPLVPGIILPPPPDFFSQIEETTTRKSKYVKQKLTTTTTTTPSVSVIRFTLKKPIKVITNYSDIENEVKPSTTPPSTKIYATKQRTRPKQPSVTILKPIDPYYNNRNGKPFAVYGPPAPTSTISPQISSSQVPLKHYYRTSDDINSNVVTITPTPSQRSSTTVKSAQYYYYEEEQQTNSITTQPPNTIVQNFFNLPDHYFETPRQIQPPRTEYIYVTPKYNFLQQREQQHQTSKPDNFRRNLAKLKKHIQYHTSPRPIYREIHSPRPVYQYSFQAANYKSQDFRPSKPETNDGFRPMPKYSVQIQPAIDISIEQPQNEIYYRQTTPRPQELTQNYYTTPRPSSYTTRTNKRGRNIQRPQYSQNQDYDYYVRPDVYYDQNDSTFGQRIPNTTSIPRYSTRSPNVVYVTAKSQKPISLEGDTLVNYIKPRPINPQSELIQKINYIPRPIQQYHQENNQPRQQQLAIIPENTNEDSPSYISYSLPGDNGAHFYFRTPQLINRRDDNSNNYYYDRIRRNSKNKR